MFSIIIRGLLFTRKTLYVQEVAYILLNNEQFYSPMKIGTFYSKDTEI